MSGGRDGPTPGAMRQVFFCEYNDPIYVKLAKLEVMVRKATAGNVELVLSELKECVSAPA